jgi:hypothetical protein
MRIGLLMMAVSMTMSGAMAQGAPAAETEFVNTLMPQPAELTVGSGRLAISQGLTVTWDKTHDDRLEAAAAAHTDGSADAGADGGSGHQR